ncbi:MULTISPECIES: DUF2637 domain-containing protein [unclassified Kitasatospora]|uniref:DUF2637 domain-containing protein n=1 Tax=unclassified Kitasatospora TaxID=2633591 RepID=UPI0007C86F37|nr:MULTISPECIES: DUF2637 domain-containing protein [unclassified Kitasatospora]
MARPTLTRAHRILLGVVAAGACLISGIGFAGSYNAVRELALEKGFGSFSYAFPIGVDAGIVVLLALDLVLTWLRIPFPLLRQTAWLLTAATIAFNAAASWGDALGMAMHAVIPVLFVVVVEASRHAVGRIAAITADRHMESVRLMRWVLSPVPTFRLWRRMKLWELRSYDETVRLEQNRLVYRAQLRFRYGRGWRRSAPFQALLPLKLAKYGVPLDPSILDRIDGPLESALVARLEPAPLAAEPTAVQVDGRVPMPAQTRAEVAEAQLPEPVLEPKPVAVAAALAGPTLAKLAAVRLRDAQEHGVAEQSPVPTQSELNVWTARAVRSHAQPTEPVHTARVPGQPSPWFKAPRPTRPGDEPAEQPAPRQFRSPEQQSPMRAESVQPQAGPAVARPVRLEQLAPQADQSSVAEPLTFDDLADVEAAGSVEQDRRPLPEPLDPELCYEALTTYIDRFQHQPDPQRLAEFLTREYGVAGSRPDGSVSPKDVERYWSQLEERYIAAGRD